MRSDSEIRPESRAGRGDEEDSGPDEEVADDGDEEEEAETCFKLVTCRRREKVPAGAPKRREGKKDEAKAEQRTVGASKTQRPTEREEQNLAKGKTQKEIEQSKHGESMMDSQVGGEGTRTMIERKQKQSRQQRRRQASRSKQRDRSQTTARRTRETGLSLISAARETRNSCRSFESGVHERSDDENEAPPVGRGNRGSQSRSLMRKTAQENDMTITDNLNGTRKQQHQEEKEGKKKATKEGEEIREVKAQEEKPDGKTAEEDSTAITGTLKEGKEDDSRKKEKTKQEQERKRRGEEDSRGKQSDIAHNVARKKMMRGREKKKQRTSKKQKRGNEGTNEGRRNGEDQAGSGRSWVRQTTAEREQNFSSFAPCLFFLCALRSFLLFLSPPHYENSRQVLLREAPQSACVPEVHALLPPPWFTFLSIYLVLR